MAAGANPTGIVVRNPNVHWTTLEDEGVLVNLDTGYYYTLNRVGMATWESLAERRTFDELLAAICGRFDVSRDTARADLIGMLEELQREDLVLLSTAG